MQHTSVIQDIDYWIDVREEQLKPSAFFQRIDSSIANIIKALTNIESLVDSDDKDYLQYIWAKDCRDFSVLLRDALLASVKYTQKSTDNQDVKYAYLVDLASGLNSAAKDLRQWYFDRKLDEKIKKEFEIQLSPIPIVVEQLEDLQKQVKKIFRSSDKIDVLRLDFEELKKDFSYQFQRQVNVVHSTSKVIKKTREILESLSTESTHLIISSAIRKIDDQFVFLENLEGLDSIEVLSFGNNDVVNIPVSIVNGQLTFKYFTPKSELANWFSSNIYPKAIELETKRNQTVDKALLVLNNIRSRLSALIINEKDIYKISDSRVKKILGQFVTEQLIPLEEEELKISKDIDQELQSSLIASNVFNKEYLLLPNTDSDPIINISRDASKRLTILYSRYKKKFSDVAYNQLSKYIQIEPTSAGQFVNNKLIINDKDDSLSLFLKKGYLGRSFTVQRPDLLKPIVNTYDLWKKGIYGSVLIYGGTGYGKSTLMGMLSHGQIEEQIIHLRAGEVTFVKHATVDPTYDLGSVIEEIYKRTIGEKVVLNIDDLELWHDNNHSLFDSIKDLHLKIEKYRKRLFFIVSSGQYLKERITVFRDLSTVFTLQVHVSCMDDKDIKKSILLRDKGLSESRLSKDGRDKKLAQICNLADGNAGLAMIEFCRVMEPAYNFNMKSCEFGQIVVKYAVLLEFIINNNNISISDLKKSLTEVDFSDTLKNIDFLCSLKILIRPHDGKIIVNPLLIHFVERELDNK